MWRDGIVVDGHMDTPLRMADEELDIGARAGDGHVDLQRLREGGVDAVFFAAWIDPQYAPQRALARALDLLAVVRRAADVHNDRAGFAGSGADVRRIAGEGRIALLAGVENGQAVERDPANIALLQDAGARYLTLTWMNTNALADAAGDVARHGGLSAVGREVVDEMHRAGMLVDLAHAAPSTFWSVIERAPVPVVVSHACTEAYGPHPRNVDDTQLAAIAENGGVVGINFFPTYLAPGAETTPSWNVIVDHIERVIEAAGPDHAALGSDLDGIPSLPVGFAGAADFPLIPAEMERRGYPTDVISGVLGGNWLRVLEQVVKDG